MFSHVYNLFHLDMADKLYVCNRSGCRKTFKTNSGRCKHQAKCTLPLLAKNKEYEKLSDDKVKCLMCEKILGNLFSFYRHKKNQHTTQKKKKTAPKVFKCSQCPREFSMLWKLQRHEPVHTKVNFICGKCGKCFSRSSWYNKHGLTCSGEQYVPSDDNEADEVDFYNFCEKEDFNDEHNDNDDSSKDDNEDPFNNETDETYDILR